MNRPTTSLILLGAPLLLAATYQIVEQPTVYAPEVTGEFHGFALQWGDFDLDGFEDVFAIAGSRGALLRNEGNGNFSDVTVAQCLDPEARVERASWADYNGDGWLDLLLVKSNGDLALWRSDEGGCFLNGTNESGLSEIGGVRSAEWLDYDRDGLLDLHLIGVNGHTLLHGAQKGPFAAVSAGPAVLRSSTTAAGTTTAPGSARRTPGGSAGATISGPSGTAVGAPGTYSTPCSLAVYDQATQACINASSDPTIGLLYPLSSDFNVDAGGDIHFGDGSDRTTVIQQGNSASLVTADGGGNVYIQAGANLNPGSTARLLFTGMQGTPVHASIDADGDVGIGVNNPLAQLHIKGAVSQSLIQADIGSTKVFEVTDTGRVVTTAVEITGGGDLVEGFETSDDSGEPGTVMIIDEENVGQLVASGSAYDTKVAGVVSGAGGVHHGIRMGQDDVLDGDTLLAMTGRVYVKCSAENGAIRPGDRLTTAALAGHAMKVTDNVRSVGAVIGKAMSALDEGTGLVLVLVNLQ